MDGIAGMMSNQTMGMNRGVFGMNFLDILFQEIMLKGFAGISLIAFLQFYLYLSLDKIKELFKNTNDLIAAKAKQYMESYGNKIVEYVKTYVYVKIEKISNLVKRKWTKIKAVVQEKEDEAPIPTVTKSEKREYFYTELNSNNKVDLISVGNFLFKNRMKLEIVRYNGRPDSDKYKSSEIYLLPNVVTYRVPTTGIEIIFDQDIEFKMICEVDNEKRDEILKDIKYKIPEENNVKKTNVCDLDRIERELFGGSQDDSKIRNLINNLPSFLARAISRHAEPENFFSNELRRTTFLIYYTKKFDILKALMEAIYEEKLFSFNGKQYKMYESGHTCSKDRFKSNEADFFKDLDKYCGKMIAYVKENNQAQLVDDFVQQYIHIFDQVIEYKPSFKIYFKHEAKTNYELSIYCRQFMTEVVMDYYNTKVNKKNDTISIYKLDIEYDSKMVKKENPRYKEWEERYGEKVTEAKEKEKDKDKDKDKEKDKDEKSEDNKPDDIYDEEDYLRKPVRRSNPAYQYTYIPPAPVQIIEQEMLIPKAVANHIKSDRKPFEYLYLQESDKQLLSSYLKNFKNNKELYVKFGFPYKGGILLSGEPGCGKSSTIIAIATYLNKDIYYLDLGKIKTNNELKICVDYVKINSQNGGVIIFEDIDCMTDIVYQRADHLGEESIYAKKEKDTDKDDKLSLSFLLNILDGTMAPEDTIFVMTTNHVKKLDRALIRPGRIDINIELKKCNKYQLRQIYQDLYGKKLSAKIVDRFREYEYITADVILHLFHNIYNDGVKKDELFAKFLK